MANIIDLGPVMLIPKGVWDAEITYERLNVVRHGSAAWICKVETSTGVEPSEDSTDWLILVKDISSVTSVNGQRGDVIIELTETETPPVNDNSNRVATTEWVTDKIEALGTDTISTDVEALKKSMLNVEGTANTAVSSANSKVSKDGDTMTGTLVNTASPYNIVVKSLEQDKTMAPSANAFAGIEFRDKNDERVSWMGTRQSPDGLFIFEIQAMAGGGTLTIKSDSSVTMAGRTLVAFTTDNKIQFPNGTQIWVA